MNNQDNEQTDNNTASNEPNITPDRVDRFIAQEGDWRFLTPEEAAKVMTREEALAKLNKEMQDMGMLDADGNEIADTSAAE